jgi:hypothetical protein
MNKLKPVTFVSGKYNHNRQNTSQQIMLLNALRVTQDPRELRKIIGVKRIADVYRTLDKMALRKEYHEALARNGIDFDFILNTLKTEMVTGDKSADRINAAKTVMKSLGLDKYEDASISGGGWEDELMKAQDQSAEKLPKQAQDQLYEVKQPKIPDAVLKEKKKERELGKSLYEL